jgi:hypothetical protein
MGVLLTTTGIVGSVTINDFGGRVFTHPIVNEILSDEFTYSEIRESVDLGVALNSGEITITNNGDTVLNSNDLKFIQPEPNSDASLEGGAITLDRVYSLTLTGNSNYLDIPTIADFNIIKVNSTKAVDIKGLTSTNVQAGFTIAIHNISNFEHKYKKNQGASPADFRFDFDGDFKSKKKSFTYFIWEDSTSRWNRLKT